ncbi:MAG: hypothetical protein ACI9CV_000515 [Ilumatobacter sp.]|jgi:hypothetical protein
MLDKVAGMVDGPLVAAYRDAAIGRESGDIKLMPAGAARWRKQGLRARAGPAGDFEVVAGKRAS